MSTVFISPLFLKHFFCLLDIEIMDWIFFSFLIFSILKMFTVFWPLMRQMSGITWIIICLYAMWHLSTFSLFIILIFCSLTWLSLYLSFWGVGEFIIESVYLWHQIWKKLRHYSFKNILMLHSLFFWISNIHITLFNTIPQFPKVLFFLFAFVLSISPPHTLIRLVIPIHITLSSIIFPLLLPLC